MEYLGFCVTRYDAKPMDKNTSNKINEDTKFSERITSVYGFSELLTQYVGKTLT